jgi:hypothetical protein
MLATDIYYVIIPFIRQVNFRLLNNHIKYKFDKYYDVGILLSQKATFDDINNFDLSMNNIEIIVKNIQKMKTLVKDKFTEAKKLQEEKRLIQVKNKLSSYIGHKYPLIINYVDELKLFNYTACYAEYDYQLYCAKYYTFRLHDTRINLAFHDDFKIRITGMPEYNTIKNFTMHMLTMYTIQYIFYNIMQTNIQYNMQEIYDPEYSKIMVKLVGKKLNNIVKKNYLFLLGPFLETIQNTTCTTLIDGYIKYNESHIIKCEWLHLTNKTTTYNEPTHQRLPMATCTDSHAVMYNDNNLVRAYLMTLRSAKKYLDDCGYDTDLRLYENKYDFIKIICVCNNDDELSILFKSNYFEFNTRTNECNFIKINNIDDLLVMVTSYIFVCVESNIYETMQNNFIVTCKDAIKCLNEKEIIELTNYVKSFEAKLEILYEPKSDIDVGRFGVYEYPINEFCVDSMRDVIKSIRGVL